MRLGLSSMLSPRCYGASALGLWASLVALLCVKQADAHFFQCGSQYHALFAANGLDLYLAVRCYTLGQLCTHGSLPTAAQGNKGTIQLYYGIDMNDWCTGEVSLFQYLFFDLQVSRHHSFQMFVPIAANAFPWLQQTFNEPIGNWNTSSVTNMVSTFRNAQAFNQSIGTWLTSKVTFMDLTFFYAAAFDQDLSGWDVSKVTTMESMFTSTPFNHDISSWNVGKVSSFHTMFYANKAFNQDVSAWPVQAGCDFDGMFALASSFNQDLNSWRAKVTSPLSKCSSGVSFYSIFYESKCPVRSNILPNDAWCQTTKAPSSTPSAFPTSLPSGTPSLHPSSTPSVTPTSLPSRSPSVVPTMLPSQAPFRVPSKRSVDAATVTVSNCIRKAFTKRSTWCCRKSYDCKVSIMTACKSVSLAAGKTLPFLFERADSLVNGRC